MKKILLIVMLILSCQLLVQAQTVFELDRPQSMLISGKGIGQDATVNPFAGEDCYAIVKNIGNEIFFVRVQQNGKVIEILTINKNEAVKVKLLIGYELYLDTKSPKKVKASIDYIKNIPMTLHNGSFFPIYLSIPGVMNPNLYPKSNSGVSLDAGQVVYFFPSGKNGEKEVLFTVGANWKKDTILQIDKMIKVRRKTLNIK